MSKLIIGTVQMGLNYGINNSSGKISIKESHRILERAYSSGITTIDTAEVYGSAHHVIGDFHRQNPNINFHVVTKLPQNIQANSVEIKVAKYLEDLGVDSLETLMFHSFESFVNNHHVVDVLVHLKSNGYIKNIGVSIYKNEQAQYLIDQDSISVVQMPFNLLDNIANRGDLMNRLKRKGKVIHSRSAFLQGLFFKKYDDQNIILKKLNSELEMLKQITIKFGCSMEELALSYCLMQENIDKVIIGVDSMNHLEANLDASSYLIGEKMAELINTIKVEDLDLLNPSLWN